MVFKLFSSQELGKLKSLSSENSRKRQHRNLHDSYDEICQTLLNVIEVDSYVKPHKHINNGQPELLVCLEGSFAVVAFDNHGKIFSAIKCAPAGSKKDILAVRIPSEVWHTVVPFEKCVILEVKQGPFNPEEAKIMAPWAPEEHSEEKENYMRSIKSEILTFY